MLTLQQNVDGSTPCANLKYICGVYSSLTLVGHGEPAPTLVPSPPCKAWSSFALFNDVVKSSWKFTNVGFI